jgi:hypothetical protein
MTTVINIRSLSAEQLRLLYRGQLPGYVYIGRHWNTIGKWGNFYSHRPSNQPHILVPTRELAIKLHREDVLNRASEGIAQIKAELKDKILECWCKPLACHGDTYAEIADRD